MPDAFQEAQRAYHKGVERRARAKRVSIPQYFEQAQVFPDGDVPALKTPAPVPSRPAVNQLEDRARESHLALEVKFEPPLPETDAILDIVVREPKGVFRFRIEIPEVGKILVNNLRNERGYKDALVEGLTYRLYGIIKE